MLVPVVTGAKCFGDHTVFECHRCQDEETDCECAETLAVPMSVCSTEGGHDASKCRDAEEGDCCSNKEPGREPPACAGGYTPVVTGAKCWGDHTVFECHRCRTEETDCECAETLAVPMSVCSTEGGHDASKCRDAEEGDCCSNKEPGREPPACAGGYMPVVTGAKCFGDHTVFECHRCIEEAGCLCTSAIISRATASLLGIWNVLGLCAQILLT
eukprot:TRINITY_DN11202_c0_g1_i2.p1 TRINITY_DN11202_c0_g1~~TRINITY_DN11202_c0_g1_i2.p1  ORF type:complete len:214 (+),score=38.35 TRINITY_DN11202_c0_g1_i2:173-814(+)